MKVVHERDRAETRLLGGRRDLDELVEHLVGRYVWVVEVRDMEIECDRSAHRFSVAVAP
jgi:hypothetical protein